MGIIAGIFTRSGGNCDASMLDAMISCQRHRDPSGDVVSINDAGILMGGVDHFDLFAGSTSQVLIDGIVLVEDADIQEASRQLDTSIPYSSSKAVLFAYRRWRLQFMNKLGGEFSCAIWDVDKNRLILARDPFGHKPLHYYKKTNNTLFFSSEIKGLLAAGVPAELDLVSLSDFLSLNCIPCPATIFKDIYQVPPGSMLIADPGGIRIKTWWEPRIVVDQSITFEDAVSGVSSAFKRSVEQCMLKSETYCFLSGGMDSSALISFATEIANRKIHAVSIGFEEEEENELQDAATMARHVGAEHHSLIVKPDSFFDMLGTLVWHHDSPFTDTSAYPTYFAAKAGAGFTDIILTGDGPDQTMGGSGHYVFAVKNNIFAPRSHSRRLTYGLASRLLETMAKDPVPSLFSKAYRKLYRESLSPVHAAYDIRSYFPDIVKRFLCSDELWDVHLGNNPYRHPESWFRNAGSVDDVNKYLYSDMKFYLPDDLMIKVDRMCMAHGLETLSPFLDRDLVAIINQLPGSFKVNSKDGKITTKRVLKEICRKRFPPSILNKRKQGFGIPLEKWLRQDDGKFLKEILLDERTLNRPYFKKKSLKNLVETFLLNKGDYFYPSPNAVAGLLTLELWHRNYLD